MTCELYNGMQRGSTIAITADLTALLEDLKEVKPTMMYSVPTLFKRVFDKIQDKVMIRLPKSTA
jgi:long-chain acyl-CoA synthetase